MFGAIVGDTVGSVFEFNNIKTKDFQLFSDESCLTDDSIMTLAVCEILQNKWHNDEQKIIETLKKWGRAYPNAGYGGMFIRWLMTDMTKPYNSFGNGSAMRVSACGWYGRDEEEVKEMAKCVTQVTHNHKEGIKGAEVTAMCIYYARIGKDKEFIKDYVEKYYSLDFDYEELKKTYAHEEEICQVTVPQAIYCFLISKDFEDCVRTTISIGGDCDTTSAISCAIAEAYYKDIPNFIYGEIFKRLPKDVGDCHPSQIVTMFLRDQSIINCVGCEINDNIKMLHTHHEEKEYDRQTVWSSDTYCNELKGLVDYTLNYEVSQIYQLSDSENESLWQRDFDAFIAKIEQSKRRESSKKNIIEVVKLFLHYYSGEIKDFKEVIDKVNIKIKCRNYRLLYTKDIIKICRYLNRKYDNV